MIDANQIISNFGEDVLLENLSSESKYIFNKTKMLDSKAQESTRHLLSPVFLSSNELISFLAEFNLGEIDLCSESINSSINDSLLLFFEYKGLINPSFSYSTPETWDNILDKIVSESVALFELYDGKNNSVEEDLFEVRADISNEQIRKACFDDLDDNSILLMYGLITGKYTTDYSEDMRHTVFNHVKNNRERTSAGKIILGTLRESAVGIDKIVGKYGLNESKKVQKNRISLLEFDGSVHSIQRIGNNKYSINISDKKLNKK